MARFTLLALLLPSIHAYIPSLPRNVVRADGDKLPSGIPRPPEPPLTYNATAESLNTLMDGLTERETSVVDEIVASVDASNATFDNVLLPYLLWENERIRQARPFGAYGMFSTDEDLQAAAENNTGRIASAIRTTLARQDFFTLVDAVNSQYGNDSSLGLENLRALNGPTVDSTGPGLWTTFKNNGQDLKDDSERKALLDLQDRLQDAVSNFGDTVDNDNTTIFFTAGELDGVDTDVVSRLKPGEGDKLIVPVTDGNFAAVMAKAKNATTRYEMYMAYGSKAPSNVDTLKDIITLRDQIARLLGFPDYATYKTNNQMAKTPEAVDGFLADLAKRLTPASQKIIDYEKELKKKEEGNADHFFAWDAAYYEEKTDEDNSVNFTLISEWFEVNTTVSRVLDIYSVLFGLRFDRIDGEDADQLSSTGKGSDLLLHPDQQLYAVWDSAPSSSSDDSMTGYGDFKGYVCLDLFVRDSKGGGSFQMLVTPSYTRQDGTRAYSHSTMSLDVVKSESEKPSLLTQDQLSGLFHELGHCMHQILSETKYARINGPIATPIDFVETPSQLMEQWAYIPEVLKRVSRHYSYISPTYADIWRKTQGGDMNAQQPEETLPESQIESINNDKNAYSALSALKQVYYATYDMRINEADYVQKQINDLDMTTLFNQLKTNMTLTEGAEAIGKGWTSTHMQSTFTHISTSGYGVGYYGYQYALVNCIDVLYTAFLQDPFSSEAGGRWRRIVLEPGAIKDPEAMLEEFLGRKPSDEAYFKDLNMTTPAP